MSGSNIDSIEVGGTYQHIDGPTYMVKEILPDATGYEMSGKIGKTVQYEQLEAGKSYPAGTIWTRKVEDFLGTIEVEGEIKRIFELIMKSSLNDVS